MQDEDIPDAAAQALGRKRWAGTTAEERSEHMRMMVAARWKKWREHQKALRKVRKRRRGKR